MRQFGLISARHRQITRRIQMRHALTVVGLLLSIGCLGKSGYAQISLTPFQKAAVQAFNPGNKAFSAISMSGTAVWTAGSLSETGTVTLQILSNGSFTETWNLPTQSHMYQSTVEAGVRSCIYTDPTGKQNVINDLSCMQTVPWFAPWFGLDSMASGLAVIADTTQPLDTTNGQKRLSFTPNVTVSTGTIAPGGKPETLFQQGTLVYVSYDLESSLPTSIRFDQLIDSDESHAIQREASFADYRSEGGYVIPHHIQRFIQRTLQADITIDTVTAQ